MSTWDKYPPKTKGYKLDFEQQIPYPSAYEAPSVLVLALDNKQFTNWQGIAKGGLNYKQDYTPSYKANPYSSGDFMLAPPSAYTTTLSIEHLVPHGGHSSPYGDGPKTGMIKAVEGNVIGLTVTDYLILQVKANLSQIFHANPDLFEEVALAIRKALELP